MVSPLPTAKLTFSSARTMPERVRNSTLRPSTDSVGAAVIGAPSCASPGINQIAQPVAEQIEAEPRHHQRGAGKKRDPPFAANDIGGTFGDHDAPFRRRRPYAQPN